MDALLNMVATITRATSTGANSWGQAVETWATAGTTRCRVHHIGAREMLEQGEAVVSDHKAWFPFGADIHNRDRITVGGSVYECKWVEPNVGGQSHHVMAFLKLVEN